MPDQIQNGPSGRIVGTVVNFGEVGPTLEGDPRFYLDDSHTPQVKATGTEEWAMGGLYWRDGHQTSLPLGGVPSTTANPPGDDVDGAALYRFLVADSIPFNRRAVLNWEHGVANTSRNPYRAVVLWYGTPAITATLTDHLDDAFAENRMRTVLLAFFAVTAISLACIGLYGTLSYSVNVRKREVGLRLALGALRSQIVKQFLWLGIAVTLLGCLAGWILAIASGRLLSGMLYGVSPSDATTLAAVVALVLGASVAASLVPAMRAARVEPMQVLREE